MKSRTSRNPMKSACRLRFTKSQNPKNKRKRKDQRMLATFDTEDDSKGNVLFLDLFDGENHASFVNAEDMRNHLKSVKQSMMIWAVNLEYDLINLFFDDLESFPKRIWFGKSRLMCFMFGNHLFYDTTNHWKISVEKMGKIVGLAKTSLDQTSKESIETRCKTDTEITWRFVNEMNARYKKIGARAKSTVPSTTLNLFRFSYNKLKFLVPDKEQTEFTKQAYFGGRTECFFIGHFKSPGKIFYVDVNSMYSFVMMQDYPHPYYYKKGVDLNSFGVTECEVESNLRFPVLPLRHEGKLVFPNGRFRGVWANCELNYAQKKGVKILKTHKGYYFPYSMTPFRAFVKEIYEKRKQTNDPLMRDTYKLVLNSLYGKFGQGRERKKVIPLREYLDNYSKFTAKNLKGSYIYQDKFFIYTEESEEFSNNTIMIWACYVTARARIKLHGHIEDVHKAGGVPLYCDTDSIIYEGDRAPDSSDELGGLKVECELDGLEIKLPKMYRAYRNEEIILERVKGVPRRHQREFFDKGEVTFMRPNKLMESMRRGIKPNFWAVKKRRLLSGYNKGIVTKTGFVVPLTLC